MISTPIDALWLTMATALIFFMQPGFTCLESGLTRAKNTINVAAKNLTDFVVVVLIYWIIGYGLMFGESRGGLIGVTRFAPDSHGDIKDILFVLFQMMFCATAATIVSGAIAERTRFSAYVWISIVMTAVLYPLFGHWVWNDAGWLKAAGFVDFAGSTVVHSAGGWVALAACIVIGPRIGRFGPNAFPMRSNNMVLSVVGAMLIWIGWIGFNGGSTLAWNDQVPGIILVTLLGGAAGCIGTIILTMSVRRVAPIGDMINGSIAGLVAITAGADVFSSGAAVLVGMFGGALSILASMGLEKMKIDDPVGAIPAHLVSGIWGTLSVAIFAPLETLPTAGRLSQLGAQGLGIAVAGLFCFGGGYLILRLLNSLIPLRVSAADEQIGLNISEHNASSATNDLLIAMEHQRLTGLFDAEVPVERGTVIGDVAQQYNLVLKRMGQEVAHREEAVQDSRRARDLAEAANRAKSDFLANMSHELRTPLNAIIGFSDIMQNKLFGPLGCETYEDYARDINQSGEHLLGIIQSILDLSKAEQNRLELREAPVSVSKLFQDTDRMLRLSAQNKQISLMFSMDPALPDINADGRVMTQILMNLVGNSIKFTDSDGTIQVIASMEDDGRMAISVRDTGIGMSRDEVVRAMEPFTQVHDAMNKPVPGTGLGLPLSRALAHLHDATFTLTSEPGNGSLVVIRLPRTRIIDASEVQIAASAD